MQTVCVQSSLRGTKESCWLAKSTALQYATSKTDSYKPLSEGLNTLFGPKENKSHPHKQPLLKKSPISSITGKNSSKH